MLKPKLKPFSMLPSLKLLSTLVLLSLSCSCALLRTKVDVPNAHFTYLSEASAEVYATQFEFLVKGTTDISLAQWTEESKGQMCMPLADWGAFNTMISAMCSAKHIDCDYQISTSGQSVRTMFNTLFLNMQHASKVPFRKIQ